MLGRGSQVPKHWAGDQATSALPKGICEIEIINVGTYKTAGQAV